jgi:hypothetical protein
MRARLRTSLEAHMTYRLAYPFSWYPEGPEPSIQEMLL